MQTPFNPNPRDCGGPENSLNLWNEGDTGTGAGRLRQRLLADAVPLRPLRHWTSCRGCTVTATCRACASVDAALTAEGATDLYRRDPRLPDHRPWWTRSSATRGHQCQGRPKARVTTPSLRSTVNLANPDVNDDPGAAPNGADYVPLQGAERQRPPGSDLRSLSFAGAPTLPPIPLAVDHGEQRPGPPRQPGAVVGQRQQPRRRAPSPRSPCPPTDPTLRFLAKYGAEAGFDYGYVLVSTDGGATYTPIPGDQTVDGPLGPALNGTTTGFEPHSYDLSAYAGQTVLLGFRYVSDGGVNEGGWLIDDITVGGTIVSDGSAWRRSTRPPRSARPPWTTGTCGSSASTRARRRSRGSSSSTARAPYPGPGAAGAAEPLPRRSWRSSPTTSRRSR